jgi:hypothetical protein
MVSFSHNLSIPFILLPVSGSAASAVLAARGFHKGTEHPVDVRLVPTEAERRK